MDNQQRVNRRRRNFPAELKVEIVDCLPLENTVHFLASVPNRLIIRHCAPRVRRMLKMIDQIAHYHARTLLAYHGYIWLNNGHQYTPAVDILLRYGAAYCKSFAIHRGADEGFAGFPDNFFNDLIQYYYNSKVPKKAVHYMDIDFSLNNPAPWPAELLQPQAGEMKVEELKVDHDMQWAKYYLPNKYNPDIRFNLIIYFQGGAKCYQQMTRFIVQLCAAVHCRGNISICPIDTPVIYEN